MNRTLTIEAPNVQLPAARLTVWDYFFRALALASILLIAAVAYDLVAHPNAPTFGSPPPPLWLRWLFCALIVPCGIVMSGLILWRAPGNLVGRFLLLCMLGALGWQFSFGIGSPQVASLALLVFYFYWGAVGFPSFAYLLLYFPSGKLHPPNWRMPVLVYAALRVLGTVLELMSIEPGREIYRQLTPLAVNPLFVPALAPYQPLFTATIGATGLLIAPGLLLGIASLALRYRTAPAGERLQIKWLWWAASTFVLAMPIYFAFEVGVELPGGQGVGQAIVLGIYLSFGLLLVLSIGIAILRYRLLDIDVLLSRTLVYGALTAFVIVAYGLIVGYLSTALHSDNVLFSLIAAGLIAILFQPLRQRLQRTVNHRIYGERDEPYRVLTRLGERLEGALEPSSALPLTVETVAQALKLPYAAITLKQDETFVPVATYGNSSPQGGITRLPLVYAGETIGELVAGWRSPGEPLTEADRRLLGDLSRQIGVAAHAALLAEDLEQVRLQIVATREETQRRLGNDLHDGVGHQLTGLMRKAELASNMLASDPARTQALLAELTGQLNSAIRQVRGLAHQLHPPELEFLGLVGALRERAQLGSRAGFVIRLEAPDKLPPVPTAIETAAYYIALEAMTNAEKHSRAHECLMTVRLDSDEGGLQRSTPVLLLEITDDGRGLAPDKMRQTGSGLGLLSMQARAAEMGGTCLIESGPSGGTRVSVRLPCPRESGRVPQV